jgi:transmembrane sensor
MSDQRSEKLLKKYLNGDCTPEENAIVEAWYNKLAGTQTDQLAEPDYPAIKNQVFDAILNNRKTTATKVKTMWPRIAAAASILLFLSIGAYFMFANKSYPPITLAQTSLIHTGGTKAVLTLANGQQIVLTDAKNGALTNQGNTSISKTGQGQILYSALTGNAPVTQVSYNTIATPRGGQYEVILPDSSHVWLNAASSIRFPTAFNGSSREVTVTGEAYFEVAHNANKPFRVKSGSQTIEVLGTHFNVKAYADEEFTKTTLLQGSVRLNGSTMLKPGQQGLYNGSSISVKTVDTEEAIAWKDGKFKFANQNIKNLMCDVSRWYDVDIDYDGVMTNKDFSGSVSRFDQISKILNILQSTNTVHFKIEGRRITVMP